MNSDKRNWGLENVKMLLIKFEMNKIHDKSFKGQIIKYMNFKI